MREVFEEGATVAAIARLITRAPVEMRYAAELAASTPLEPDGERPPLFAVPRVDPQRRRKR
jgi:hypothetical protein